jgi:UDP-galactopyranose mutase
MSDFKKPSRKEYDYVVVGAGLYGSVFAHEAKKRGCSVLVVESRSHIGGNCYTERDRETGINVHLYGPHIFHTNSKEIWNYVNQFAEFNNFVLRPKVVAPDGKLYSFPINLMTLYQVYGKWKPMDVQVLQELDREPPGKDNLEDWAISQVGRKIFNLFIKGYTEKQWGMPCKDLPSFIIKRLPIRYTFDDNYFTDKYQGIPIGGYTQIFEKLLSGIEVLLETPYEHKFERFAKRKVVYTGEIDRYFDYTLGVLGYRSLMFHHTKMDGDFQGNAVINYTDKKVPYTRSIEHKHFDLLECDKTIVTHEFPDKWTMDKIPYYPINTIFNDSLYKEYTQLAETKPNILFGGRLGSFRYYDMHQVIGQALKDVRVEFEQNAVTLVS